MVCTNASMPVAARASRNAWPSVAPDASTTDPTPTRRAHGSSAPPPRDARSPRASCHTKAARGGARASHSVGERAWRSGINASSG